MKKVVNKKLVNKVVISLSFIMGFILTLLFSFNSKISAATNASFITPSTSRLDSILGYDNVSVEDLNIYGWSSQSPAFQYGINWDSKHNTTTMSVISEFRVGQNVNSRTDYATACNGDVYATGGRYVGVNFEFTKGENFNCKIVSDSQVNHVEIQLPYNFDDTIMHITYTNSNWFASTYRYFFKLHDVSEPEVIKSNFSWHDRNNNFVSVENLTNKVITSSYINYELLVGTLITTNYTPTLTPYYGKTSTSVNFTINQDNSTYRSEYFINGETYAYTFYLRGTIHFLTQGNFDTINFRIRDVENGNFIRYYIAPGGSYKIDYERPQINNIQANLENSYVNILNQETNVYTNKTSLPLRITASDSLELYEIVVNINGSDNTSKTSGKTSLTLDSNYLLKENYKNTVIVKSKDVFGYSNEFKFYVTVDKENSSIDEFKVNSSTSTIYTNTTSISVDLKASDKYSGVNKIILKDDASQIKEILIDPNSRSVEKSNINVDLINSNLGIHSISACGYDKFGNGSCSSIDVYFDNVDPSVSIEITGNKEAQKGYTNTTSITVSITKSDANSGIDSVSIDESNTNLTKENKDSYSLELINDTLGNHKITASVCDKANNCVSDSYTIYFDNVSPIIDSLTSIGNSDADKGYTNTRDVKVNLESKDDNSGMYSISINKIEGLLKGVKVNNQDYNIKLKDELGNQKISVSIKDNAGNIVTKTTSIYFDDGRNYPEFDNLTIIGNSGADKGYTNTSDVSVKVIASGSLTGFKDITILDQFSSLYSSNLTTLPTAINEEIAVSLSNDVDNHNLKVTLMDRCANKVILTGSIYLDSVNASIDEFSIKGNKDAQIGYTNTKEISLIGKASDSDSGIRSVNLNQDDSEVYSCKVVSGTKSIDCSNSISVVFNEQGSYDFELVIIDRANNITTKTFTIIYDTISPSLKADRNELESTITITIDDANPYFTNISSSEISYYLSTRDISDYNLISEWLVLADSDETVIKVPRGEFNLYLNHSNYKDRAGNFLNATNSKIKITNTTDNKEESLNLAKNQFDFSDGYILQDESLLIVFSTSDDAINSYSLETINKYLLTNDKILGKFLASDTIEYSRLSKGVYAYDDLIFKSNDNTKLSIIDLIVLSVNPILSKESLSEVNTSVVLNKGEEYSNVGLSFVSYNNSRIESYDTITLDGVLVDKLDTNIPGTYSIKTTAIDEFDNVSHVIRTIVVLDNNTDKVEEIEMIPLQDCAINNASKEFNKESEEIKVYVRYLRFSDTNITTYKKEDNEYEIEEALILDKLNDFVERLGFKLFSKYFFKIYDG